MKIEPGRWNEIGVVSLGLDDKLVLPDTAHVPAIYRFRLTDGGTTSVYIGESEDISRRFGQYRTPESSQRTNIRVNKWISDCIKAGDRLEVAVVAEAVLRVGESCEQLDLGSRTSRLLVEEHLLEEVRRAGETVMNLS